MSETVSKAIVFVFKETDFTSWSEINKYARKQHEEIEHPGHGLGGILSKRNRRLKEGCDYGFMSLGAKLLHDTNTPFIERDENLSAGQQPVLLKPYYLGKALTAVLHNRFAFVNAYENGDEVTKVNAECAILSALIYIKKVLPDVTPKTMKYFFDHGAEDTVPMSPKARTHLKRIFKTVLGDVPQHFDNGKVHVLQ